MDERYGSFNNLDVNRKDRHMGKKVRVFLGEEEVALLSGQKECTPSSQNCFFCDLLDCRYIQHEGSKTRLGLVRLYGKDLSIYYSQHEGCWLPYSA